MGKLCYGNQFNEVHSGVWHALTQFGWIVSYPSVTGMIISRGGLINYPMENAKYENLSIIHM